MINAFVNAFDALWDAQTTAQCKLRIGTHTILKAMCSGLNLQREESEQGLYKEASCVVRLKASDESPRYPLAIDRVVELQLAGSGDWIKLRIAARRAAANMLILEMETPYE